MKTAYIVEPDYILRVGTRVLLEQCNVQVIGESANAEDAWDSLRLLAVDLVALEVDLPIPSGLELLERLAIHRPAMSILVHTNIENTHVMRCCFSQGVAAYVLKRCAKRDFATGCQVVSQGGCFITKEMVAMWAGREGTPETMAGAQLWSRLAPTERRVVVSLLKHWDKHRRRILVCEETGISTNAYKSYVNRIRRKLGLAGIRGLIDLLAEHNLLGLGRTSDPLETGPRLHVARSEP